jgi:hypothetical protein
METSSVFIQFLWEDTVIWEWSQFSSSSISSPSICSPIKQGFQLLIHWVFSSVYRTQLSISSQKNIEMKHSMKIPHKFDDIEILGATIQCVIGVACHISTLSAVHSRLRFNRTLLFPLFSVLFDETFSKSAKSYHSCILSKTHSFLRTSDASSSFLWRRIFKSMFLSQSFWSR